jgi:hypothetical protein
MAKGELQTEFAELPRLWVSSSPMICMVRTMGSDRRGWTLSVLQRSIRRPVGDLWSPSAGHPGGAGREA